MNLPIPFSILLSKLRAYRGTVAKFIHFQLPADVIEEVTLLNVTTAITSATLNWVIPTEASLVYELQYYPSLFPFHTVTLNTTQTSREVVKLIPQLRYEFRVRVYTPHGRGDWTTVSSLLDRKIRKDGLLLFGMSSLVSVCN